MKDRLLPKIIVLDFDGVIVESNNIKHNAFKEIFNNFKEYELVMEYHYSNPMTDRYEKFSYIFNNLIKLENSNKLEEACGKKFNELTLEAVVNCPYVFGALEFLKYFSEKSNLYLASATPTKELKQILESRNIRSFFKKVYGAPLKKERVLTEILEIEGIDNEELLYIGDSKTDLEAAQRAKVPFIGRNSDYRFSKTRAFDSLSEIKDYLVQGD